MGIDIYLKWDGFTEKDKEAQLKGFDATIGHTGYLREAYHGEPYVTDFLVNEAFSEDPKTYITQDENDEENYGYVRIPSKKLEERLPRAIELAIERHKNLYNEDADEKNPFVKSFIDFVKLHSRLEKEGKNPRIYASY